MPQNPAGIARLSTHKFNRSRVDRWGLLKTRADFILFVGTDQQIIVGLEIADGILDLLISIAIAVGIANPVSHSLIPRNAAKLA